MSEGKTWQKKTEGGMNGKDLRSGGAGAAGSGAGVHHVHNEVTLYTQPAHKINK
jgi:hypothetical protein